MMRRLEASVAVVTGGSAGTGGAVCVASPKEGATVVVLDIERVRDPKMMKVSARYDGQPFGFGEAEDIAAIAAYLASNDSRMVTGTVTAAEGGLSAD